MKECKGNDHYGVTTDKFCQCGKIPIDATGDFKEGYAMYKYTKENPKGYYLTVDDRAEPGPEASDEGS